MSTTVKTPPYVIDFSDIRKGMTIEREWTVGEIHYRAEAVADHLDYDGTTWLTPDGYLVANNKGTAVLRVPAKTPKPALPTEPGTVITCTLDAEQSEKATAILIRDGFGCWRGLDLSGKSRFVYDDSDRITDWRVVYDPSAPKTDVTLRERVEKLTEDLTANGRNHAGAVNDFQRGKGDGLLIAVGELRHLLGSTETSTP